MTGEMSSKRAIEELAAGRNDICVCGHKRMLHLPHTRNLPSGCWAWDCTCQQFIAAPSDEEIRRAEGGAALDLCELCNHRRCLHEQDDNPFTGEPLGCVAWDCGCRKFREPGGAQ